MSTIFSERHTKSTQIKSPDLIKPLNEFSEENSKKMCDLLCKLAEVKGGLKSAVDLAMDFITKDHQDLSLMKWALEIYLIHCKEAQMLGVTIPELKDQAEFFDLVPKRIPLSNPITPDNMKDVEILAYFREDYDLNEHHYRWHRVYPYGGILDETGKQIRTIERQGEMFLFMHSQMIARYNTELISWGLDMVHPWGYDDVLSNGYIPVPTLQNSENENYGARRPFRRWYEIGSSNVDKKTMKEWRNNIFKAIDEGTFKTKKNDSKGEIELTKDTAMNLVGLVVESLATEVQEVNEGEFIDRDLYGSIHNVGHDRFAELSDGNKGVMISTKTAIRDPCFWIWHRHVDDFRRVIVNKYTHSLDEYIPKAKIKSLKIIPRENSNTPEGGIATFLGPPLLHLKEVNAKLDHEPYKWELVIKSTRSPPPSKEEPQTLTIRIFIAPKMLIQDQFSWIEMDKFTCMLTEKKHLITRKDTESSVARKTPEEGEPLNAYCSCGWPQSMMLPVGTPEGMPFVAFAMLTDDELDEASTIR